LRFEAGILRIVSPRRVAKIAIISMITPKIPKVTAMMGTKSEKGSLALMDAGDTFFTSHHNPTKKIEPQAK